MDPSQSTAKLYRSDTNRILAGVCGGLAQYLNIDVTLIRLFFVLLTLAGGSGILLYIIMAFVMPSDTQGAAASAIGRPGTGNTQGAIAIGGALLLLGMFFLIQTTLGAWIPWLEFSTLWPLLLIAAGGAVLWNRTKGGLK